MKLLLARLVLLSVWVVLLIHVEVCINPAHAAAVPGYPLEVTVTAYCLPGITSTGARVSHGVMAARGAAPYYSTLYIPGYGYGVVLDTGWLAYDQIDVWMYSCRDAIQWGRQRKVRAWVLQ